nr:MAG TPA: hypothetical protein [Crassvirales sp.]
MLHHISPFTIRLHYLFNKIKSNKRLSISSCNTLKFT